MPCSCLLAFCSAAPARLLCSSARFCSSSRVSPSTLRACALAWSTTAPACSVAASFRSDAFDKASSFICSGAPELGALWVSVGAVVMSYSSIRLLIADGYPSASGRNNERPAKHSTQRLDHPTRHSRQIERRNKVWFTRAGGYSVPTGHQGGSDVLPALSLHHNRRPPTDGDGGRRTPGPKLPQLRHAAGGTSSRVAVTHRRVPSTSCE